MKKPELNLNVELTHNSVSLYLVQDEGRRAVLLGQYDRDGFWDVVDGCSKPTQEDIARDWVIDMLNVTLEANYQKPRTKEYYREEAIDRKIEEIKERIYA